MAEVVDSNALQWHQPRGGHREEGVEFKPLFFGEEGEANNYWFTLVQIRESYHTPPHRHMFDQVRFMIKGAFNFGEQDQAEGTVGYFTEGTTYEQNGREYSFHLLLQCEGGSRQKYFSVKSLREATAALKEQGEFVSGKFRYPNGREVDSYEAIYHYLTGEWPSYDEPRYDRPVIMRPDSFAWEADPDHEGVEWRDLGTFNERKLQLRMLRVEPGSSATLSGGESGVLGYMVNGKGELDGTACGEGAGLRLDEGETVELLCSEASQLLLIDLPAK